MTRKRRKTTTPPDQAAAKTSAAAQRAEVRRMGEWAKQFNRREAERQVEARAAAIVDAALARQRQADGQADLDRYRGGPCSICGVSHHGQMVPDGQGWKTVPGWTVTSYGPTCTACQQEYLEAVGMTPAARHVRMVLDALGRRSVPFLAEVEPQRFDGVRVMFSEHPGAEPSMTPWAFVDRDRLAAELNAVLHPPAPTPDAYDKRCPDCGTSSWSAMDVPDGVGGFNTVYRCLGCWAEPGQDLDIDQEVSGRVRSLTRRGHVPGIARELGLTSWSKAGRSEPPTVPFGWWPDLTEAFRKRWPTDADFDAWYRERNPAWEMNRGWTVRASYAPDGEVLRR